MNVWGRILDVVVFLWKDILNSKSQVYGGSCLFALAAEDCATSTVMGFLHQMKPKLVANRSGGDFDGDGGCPISKS